MTGATGRDPRSIMPHHVSAHPPPSFRAVESQTVMSHPLPAHTPPRFPEKCPKWCSASINQIHTLCLCYGGDYASSTHVFWRKSPK